jgi:hypothetical protein
MRFWRRRWARLLVGLLLTLLVLAASVVFAARRDRAALSFEHQLQGKEVRSAPRGVDGSAAGLALLFDADLLFLGKDGALRRQPSPARDRFDNISLGARGDVSLAFYREFNDVSSELRAARVDERGELAFDVALGVKRDDTCGTGQMGHAVATVGELTWVWITRSKSLLVALDASGHEVQSLEPCRCAGQPQCYCSVWDVHSHPGGLAVRTYDEKTQLEEIAWFDKAGKPVGRGPIPRRYQTAFDRNGTFVWLTSKRTEACNSAALDGEFRLIRFDARGCSAGPVLPPKLFEPGNVIGVTATPSSVYVVMDDLPTPGWKRRLRSRDEGLQLLIHRFDTAGQHLDSRWAALPSSFYSPLSSSGTVHVIGDDMLVFTLQHHDSHDPALPRSKPARWSLLGLRY